MIGVVPKLARFEQIDLRAVWDFEATSFTPWLASKENLDLLAEALGLPPLEILSTERPVGPFRADVVSRIVDSEELVLIENQIERSDHTHLGQILTYAAELKAAYIVWITSRFTDEHRAVLDWLNEITGEEFHFFAVEIEAWRIGDSLPAPRFNVVAKPNDWTKAVLSSARRAAPEGIDVNRVAYWGAFSEMLATKNLPLKLKEEPPRQGFYSFTLNRARQTYLYVFRNVEQQRIGVYLAFYGPTARADYDTLAGEKEFIEKQMGEELVWSEVSRTKNTTLRSTDMRPTR